jgi:hypothetical protein
MKRLNKLVCGSSGDDSVFVPLFCVKPNGCLCYMFTVFTALNKAWCVHHFACSVCDQKMNQKTKFYECDLKPVCKKCYDKFPNELRRRLRKAHEQTPKKASV